MLLDAVSFNTIVDNLYDGLYLVDRSRTIRYWNKAAEKISGYTAAEVVGRTCADQILTHVDGSGDDLCSGSCPLALSMSGGGACEAEIFLHHKAGHRVPVAVRITPLTDGDGAVVGAVELFTDISNLETARARVRELEALAMLDNLTRLANRHYIEKELFVRFEEQKRFGIAFGFLFMDIDHFKRVNDTYGHDVGDLVLKFVADTLVKNSRPFDLIGRWGGEEFVGIIRNVGSRQLETDGNRLRQLVASSYLPTAAGKLQVTISIGATLVAADDTMETLLKRADRLLYASKHHGRNRLTLG